MKIVVCGTKAIPSCEGGVEKGVEELCSRLVKRGHDVTVYSRRGRHTFETYRGFNVYGLPFRSSKYLCYFSYMKKVLFRILHRHDTNTLIHLHSPSVHGMWALLLKMLGYRIVLHSHGVEWQASKWPYWFKTIMKASEWVGVKSSNYIVCVSREEASRYAKIAAAGKPLQIIPNGIPNGNAATSRDILRKYNLFKGGYYLYVGRLVPQKRVGDLIRAFLKRKGPKKLVITGGSVFTDAYVDRLKRLAKQAPDIIFTGWLDRPRVMALYQHAFAFVLPSETEGCPNALLEALSFGCVSLVSDIPQHRDMGRNKLPYFPIGDWTYLAGLMSRLEESKEYFQEQKQVAAHVSASHPTWDDVTELFENVYAGVMNGSCKKIFYSPEIGSNNKRESR